MLVVDIVFKDTVGGKHDEVTLFDAEEETSQRNTVTLRLSSPNAVRMSTTKVSGVAESLVTRRSDGVLLSLLRSPRVCDDDDDGDDDGEDGEDERLVSLLFFIVVGVKKGDVLLELSSSSSPCE